MRLLVMGAIAAPELMVGGCMSASEAELVQAAPPDPALVAQGSEAFRRCSGCHSATPDGGSRAGPNLYGLAGTVAGKKDGYFYSEALAASQIVWSTETLDAYLADPDGYIPGSEMRRGTVRDPQERAAIVAYLVSLQD